MRSTADSFEFGTKRSEWLTLAFLVMAIAVFWLIDIHTDISLSQWFCLTVMGGVVVVLVVVATRVRPRFRATADGVDIRTFGARDYNLHLAWGEIDRLTIVAFRKNPDRSRSLQLYTTDAARASRPMLRALYGVYLSSAGVSNERLWSELDRIAGADLPRATR